jgi:hypothetical protein
MEKRGTTFFIESPLKRVAAVCLSTGKRRLLAAKGMVTAAGSSKASDHTSVILYSSAMTF